MQYHLEYLQLALKASFINLIGTLDKESEQHSGKLGPQLPQEHPEDGCRLRLCALDSQKCISGERPAEPEHQTGKVALASRRHIPACNHQEVYLDPGFPGLQTTSDHPRYHRRDKPISLYQQQAVPETADSLDLRFQHKILQADKPVACPDEGEAARFGQHVLQKSQRKKNTT